MAFAGEALRFDLSGYRSTVTRQMAQVRLRLTARAFGVGPGLVAANVVGDALEVDAGALAAANAAASRRLDAGPDAAVVYLRALRLTPAPLDVLGTAHLPGDGRTEVLRARHAPAQARGAARRRPGLRRRVAGTGGPHAVVGVRAEELALPGCAAPAEYRRRSARFRREYGYLYAEDVDFRAAETLDALDFPHEGGGRRPQTPPAEGRRPRGPESGRPAGVRLRRRRRATLVSQVLLARALAEHEDLNRRAKMRLLRDLRDRAGVADLDIERRRARSLRRRGERLVRTRSGTVDLKAQRGAGNGRRRRPIPCSGGR